MSVVAVYREPFGLAPRVERHSDRLSLTQMAERMRGLPEDFPERGTICVNGRPVPREMWRNIRPRPDAAAPVEVTFHAPPMGGGEDGGNKQTMAIVASIALTVATGFIAGGGLANIAGAGLFKAGSTSATILAAGVSVAGSLLISALTPPPTVPQQADRDEFERLSSASAEGNVLRPNTAIPRIVGTRKVFPPLAGEPLIYFDGEDEVVEAAYALAGPHELSDIRIAGAPVEEAADVEYETREGWVGDAAIELVTRQARTEQRRSDLRGHTLGDDGQRLESVEGSIEAAQPQPTTFVTRDEPDQVNIDLTWTQGLHRNASDTDELRVPIRLRIRELGAETWTNLPELHYRAAALRQLRASIRLIWTDSAPGSVSAATGEGWCEVRINSPAQTVAPAGTDREADSYFDAGSGDDYADASNTGSTAVQNVIASRYRAEIYLDRATFPPGRYEVEIRRGYAFRETNYTAASYTYSGEVRDFFGYESDAAPEIGQSQDGIQSSVLLLRATSIWDEHPIAGDGLALIAVRARNRRVEQVSAVAAGYVQDLGRTAAPDVDEGLTPSHSYESGDTVPDTDLDRDQDFWLAVDLETGASPSGVVWEQGGDGQGSYLGFTSGNLVFRAGDGSVSDGANTAKVSVSATEWAERSLTFIGEIDMASDSVTLWAFDHDTGLVEEVGTDTASGGLTSQWAGLDAGGVGVSSGTATTGEDGTDFSGTITELRAYNSETAPDAVVENDDSRWTRWVTTSNPAPHLRDIFAGRLNADPVPPALVDHAGLVSWRTACNTLGYTCNALLEGQSVADAARIVAAAGYGRPYMSDLWGVTRDYDRSGESPVQVFSPRNSRGFRWEKGFPKLPDGFRVSYADAERDYDQRQITVYRGNRESGGLTEQVTYEGLVTEAAARARASYDLAAAEARGAFYSLDAPAEAIKCRRGDLVGVQHDMLTEHAGAGRVVGITFDASGDVTGIELDSEVPITNEPDMHAITDMHEVEDMHLVGVTTGAALRRTDGTITTHELSNSTGETSSLTFASPVSATGLSEDVLAVVGRLSAEYRRLVVFGIEPKRDLEFSLTLVDEAPELWA